VTSSCYKEITLTIEYQCYQPLNEKLPDQPNKSIIFFSPKLSYCWQHFLTLLYSGASQKTAKFAFKNPED